jgi:hypothetical protein
MLSAGWQTITKAVDPVTMLWLRTIAGSFERIPATLRCFTTVTPDKKTNPHVETER